MPKTTELQRGAGGRFVAKGQDANLRLDEAERAAIGDLLASVKVWWTTPPGATGERERLKAVVDNVERAREIVGR